MTEFRLRIGFAKKDAAIWLSHLEVVRAMERCIRRSGLPYAISQGFSPHMKHSFTSALPVGTGSNVEYMDVELSSLVDPALALDSLQAVQHECLPVLSAGYAAKDAPSLQIYFNQAQYLIAIEDPGGTLVPDLVRSLQTPREIQVKKKGKSKTYDLSFYVVEATRVADHSDSLYLSLLSRPEGSLRPEVILAALAEPLGKAVKIISLTRIKLEHKDLG